MRHYLALFALLFSFSSFASHIAGGGIEYVCLGGDTFEINLTLIRDCSGISAPISANVDIDNDCGSSFIATLTLDTSYYDSQFCSSGLTTCQGGTLPGHEIYSYTGLVVLPDSCKHTVSYTTCCRNSSLSNLTNPGGTSVYLYADIYKQNTPCNSSTQLENNGYIAVCGNGTDTVAYSFHPYDPDGNELRFEFGCAPGGTTTYNPPYSCANPVNGIYLDSLTGELTISEFTLNSGVYFAGIVITELDANQDTVGQTYQEFFILAYNCAADSNHRPLAPQISNVSGGSHDPNVSSGTYGRTIDVCPGNLLCFDVTFVDPDVNDSLSYTSNILQALPGATVTASGTNPLVLNVCWNTPTNLQNTNFTIEVSDNYCSPGVAKNNQHYGFLIRPIGAYYNSLPDSVSICLGDTFYQSMCVPASGSISFADINGSTAYTGTYNNGCISCQGVWASPQTSGDYVLTYTDSTTTLYDTIHIAINNAPGASLGLPDTITVCQGDSVSLSVNNGSAAYWQVYDATGFNNNSYLLSCNYCPSVDISTWGISSQWVIARSGYGACAIYDTTFVNVIELSDSLYLPSYAAICEGDSVWFSTNTIGDVQWTTSSGNNITVGDHISCDTCSGVWISPDSDETYILTESIGTCSQSVSVYINTLEYVDSLLVTDSIYLCPNDTAWFDLGNVPGEVYWYFDNDSSYFGDNISNDSLTSIWAKPHYSGYLIVNHFYSGVGCMTSDSVYINVTQGNNNIITAYDTTICSGDTVILTSNGNGILNWTTTYGDTIIEGVNLSCATCNSPWATPDVTTQYVLRNNTSEFCYDTDVITITVENNSVLSGYMTTSFGNPLSNSWIYFITLDSNGNQNVIDSLYTDSLGYYELHTSHQGDLYVWAVPNAQFSNQNATYYPGELFINLATPVTLINCGTFNASYSTLLISSIDELANNLDVSVYPNPNAGEFTIQTNSTAEYNIFSISGALIKTGRLNQEVNTININDAQNGMYILQIKNELESKFISLIKE